MGIVIALMALFMIYGLIRLIQDSNKSSDERYKDFIDNQVKQLEKEQKKTTPTTNKPLQNNSSDGKNTDFQTASTNKENNEVNASKIANEYIKTIKSNSYNNGYLNDLKSLQNKLNLEIEGKKLLNKWLKRICTKCRDFDFETFDKNEYAILDLAIFFFFDNYISFCAVSQDQLNSKRFIRDFNEIFLEYSTGITADFNKKTADDFFWDRIEGYNAVMTTESDEKYGNLFFLLSQFIARDKAYEIFAEKFIMEEIFVISNRIIELTEAYKQISIILKDITNDIFEIYQKIPHLEYKSNTGVQCINWKIPNTTDES